MDAHIGLGQALTSRKTLLASALLLFSSVFWIPMSSLIQVLYPDRPIVPDLAFTFLPAVPWLSYATDVAVVASIAALLRWAGSMDRRRLPYYIATLGAAYVARALLMVLTPLGRPTGNLSSFGVLESTGLMQHGMFPSGHQMLATLCWLLIDRAKAPGLKRVVGFLMTFQALALILSRGHYSIDVAGGWMLAYAAAGAMRRWRDRFDLMGG